MGSRAREFVAPGYLLLCLVLGGSAQGVWGNMALQLIGVAIIAWAATTVDHQPLLKLAQQLLWIAMAGIVVVALQLIPLPPAVWSSLSGRAWIAKDYMLLGIPVPAAPISLTPEQGLDTLARVIPCLAIFCAIVRLKAYRSGLLTAALLAGTGASVVLGMLQVTTASPGTSMWYLYPESTYGFAVGFFANANHMASLLVITLPFVAALVASAKGRDRQRYSAVVALASGAGLVLLVGIALNRSLAAYGLVLPVLIASALIVLSPRSRWRRLATAAAGVLLLAAVFGLATSSIGSRQFGMETKNSVQSRQEILATSTEALKDYFPFGTGLGSFRNVYRLYEDPAAVTRIYVVHAHNDYVELVMELGLAGLILLVLFLLWWGRAVRQSWNASETGPFARAASIASAAILVHSLVDFPLRTAAISAVFGVCLALLADRRPPQARDSSDLRPTRHVVIP